jgi:hypothetical protein
MDYREYLALYNAFNNGYRHAHDDKTFISKSKKIIKNIMKVDGISREEAGIKLIIMCKENNYDEVKKYYV